MKQRLLFWMPSVLALGLVIVAFNLPPGSEQQRAKAALSDTSPAVRAEALRRLARDDSLILQGLHDEDPDVRFVAITRLHQLGPKGSERIKALVSLLGDDHAHVRREAAWTLVYGDPEGWKALTEALEDNNPRVRAAAAVGLTSRYRQKMERPSVPLRGMLDELVTADDPETRRDAQEAAK